MTMYDLNHGMWVAFEDYAIKDSNVVAISPASMRFKSYNPLGFPEILTEFAALTEGDESKVLNFARKWGLPRRDIFSESLDWLWNKSAHVNNTLGLIVRGDTSDTLLIEEAVNENLDLTRTLIAPGFGLLANSYVYKDLIGAIYGLLVDAAVGDRIYAACLFCTHYFQQTHKNQRYCRTACANKQRGAKWRSIQRV